MSQKSVPELHIARLKEKLNTAIKSRASLEEDFKAQSSVLTAFIGRLSKLCKGLDRELDNRLGKLRTLLTKSAHFAEIEDELNKISLLLNQQASKNDQHIREMHEKFHLAGKTLQKVNGIPPDVRRSLRDLLSNNPSQKDALIQYIPRLSELIELYVRAIDKQKEGNLNEVSTSSLNEQTSSESTTDIDFIVAEIIAILNDVQLSSSQKEKLEQAKEVLSKKLTPDALLQHLLTVFHIIIEDIRLERKVAKSFLSTLSSSLATVQQAVKSTIADTTDYKNEHQIVNERISSQLTELTLAVEKAGTLTEIKEDVTIKLESITASINHKNELELKQYQTLLKQMQTMQEQVNALDEQSRTFERRLAEQKQKSMIDALTKLNNRAAFDEYAAKAMVKFHNNKLPLAIAVIDLDNFKRINDTYGHTAGDKTLQVVAGILSKYTDESIFAARYGGEEFVVIISNKNQGEVVSILDSIRQKLFKIPFKFKNAKVNISASFGVTHVKQEDNIHQAFERADQALYKAKENGKNQVVYI